jgi:hypothetical protein
MTRWSALRARGWDGDDTRRRPRTRSRDIVTEADAARGIRRSPRRSDLDETIVEASRDAGLLEVEFDDPSRWLTIVGQGSAASYRTMQRFIATVDDHDTVGRLTDAIDGKGAFRRFYTQLERYPELLTGWHRFDNDTRLGQARQLLANEGYQPSDAS